MPKVYADQLANARRGLETGMVQPRSIVENALTLIEPEAALTPGADPLLKPFAALPASIPVEQQNALRARAARAVADGVMPQRREWARFLREDYLPRAPETLGLVNRPGGRELYAYLVRGFTTTDLTPDQVHQIGLEEVARIRARMDTEMRAAGWTGDFAGFLNFLRTDPQFYATTREDLLEKASEMAKRSDDGLPALFGTLPRTALRRAPVPREIEANYTTGRYFQGSMRTASPAAIWSTPRPRSAPAVRTAGPDAARGGARSPPADRPAAGGRRRPLFPPRRRRHRLHRGLGPVFRIPRRGDGLLPHPL
jgi:uncharacterized protein (DUF885 family)